MVTVSAVSQYYDRSSQLLLASPHILLNWLQIDLSAEQSVFVVNLQAFDVFVIM